MDINKVIIAEVQKYECLYNREMEEYRDNTYKDQVWTKIAKDIGLTFQEVKRKYRNIRDTYIKNIRKLNSTTSGSIKPYKYAKRLQFLDKYYCTELYSNSTTQHLSESSVNIKNETLSDSEFSTLKEPKLEFFEENENNSWSDPLSPTTVSTEVAKVSDPEITSKMEDNSAIPPPLLIPKSPNICTEAATSSAAELIPNTRNNSFVEPALSPPTTENEPIVINAATTSVNSLKHRHKRKYKQRSNCTMQLFQCLANKITETNLTNEQRNAIENAVCNLVYGKIAEYTIDYGSSF